MENQAVINTIPQTFSNRKLAYTVFALAASFYLYEFILQVCPSVMTTGLMRDFNIGAVGMSFLFASYYWAYTPMQIPAGLLFDRFGPRVLITVAVLMCVIGTVFFSMTNSLHLAAVGRILIGVGSAFSFIGTLILASRWFPARQYALLVGVAQFLSSIGSIVGQVPLSAMVSSMGWRETLYWLAIVGVGLAALIWFVVRDNPPGQEHTAPKRSDDNRNEFRKLLHVASNGQSWLIGLHTFFVWAPVVVFAGAWGVTFLQQLDHYTLKAASTAMAMVWLGIGVGSAVVGWWSDNIRSRNIPLTIAALTGFASISAILYIPNLPQPLFYLVMFTLGLGSSGQALSFAVVKDINPAKQLGTASGFNNMMTVAGGMVVTPLVGWLMSYFWDNQMINGAPIFSLGTYQHSFVVLPICFLSAAFLSFFCIRETHCREVAEAN